MVVVGRCRVLLGKCDVPEGLPHSGYYLWCSNHRVGLSNTEVGVDAFTLNPHLISIRIRMDGDQRSETACGSNSIAAALNSPKRNDFRIFGVIIV